MNVRLKRLLDEIGKTEERIAQWQEHLRNLNLRKKQIEDAEIIKTIRSMKLDSRRLSEVLEEIQKGKISLPCLELDDENTEINEETDQTEISGIPGEPEAVKEEKYSENEN